MCGSYDDPGVAYRLSSRFLWNVSPCLTPALYQYLQLDCVPTWLCWAKNSLFELVPASLCGRPSVGGERLAGAESLEGVQLPC